MAVSISSFGCNKKPETQNTNNMTPKTSDPINISDQKVKTTDGQERALSDYKGKVLLVVNVASK